jgi:hypothetical protein
MLELLPALIVIAFFIGVFYTGYMLGKSEGQNDRRLRF